ncbi:MAG: family 10 glycosylhydrolase, partial [Dysgonamonadaceae bacterium]|nr:family 10 glycosylhydrolase [Dysgonamonadaceae bacterium]
MKSRFIVLLFLLSLPLTAQITPKREFRGAWIHVIHQNQYQTMSVPEMKHYFTAMLDSLQALHINAIVFQVRPTADAFYYSELEPWSRYLTGEQGRAPADHFDPMAFVVELAHDRGMEFHAWLNPYRVTSTDTDVLHPSHIYFRYPERFVKYGKQLYFDPGLPENRAFICSVVQDIVSRYDVDAIHMDDYFYPYPIAGEEFPDDGSFRQYAASQGFTPDRRADWRRNNVNDLIRDIKQTIVHTRPWVRFGVSPFGIYRNKRTTPDGSGSDTNGLQNYDELYADVKLWVEKGWVDYNIPQLYWEIGHPRADYEILNRWWAQNSYGCHLYIGQSVSNTMKNGQLARKMELIRTTPGIYGNCFWPAYDLLRNTGGAADSLRNGYQRYPALIPAYLHMRDKRPKEVKALKAEQTPQGYTLHWKRNGDPRNPAVAQYFVVYRFGNKEKIHLDDPSKIVAVTRNT